MGIFRLRRDHRHRVVHCGIGLENLGLGIGSSELFGALEDLASKVRGMFQDCPGFIQSALRKPSGFRQVSAGFFPRPPFSGFG